MLFWLKKFVSFWLMPLPFCALAMLAGAVLLRTRKHPRAGRALLAAGIALLLAFSNNFVSRWLIRGLETRHPAIPEFSAARPPPSLADCRFVFVLGAGSGISPDMPATSLLSHSGLARLVEAVRILRALPDAKLIVSGPKSEGRPSHASVLARAAQILGVAPERIVEVDTAHDTEDEMNALRRLAGSAPAALVTSAWHMPRTMALARSAGVNGIACPCDYRTHADDVFSFDDLFWEVEALGRSTLGVRERIGYLWIWLRGKT